MSLHPYYPPTLLSLLFVSLVIGIITFIVLSRKFTPLRIYLSTASAFVPIILAGIWFFWAFTTYGNSGYVGVRDPREIFQALNSAFLQGAFFTFILLVLVGFIVWRTPLKCR
jgi:hypothetical protein